MRHLRLCLVFGAFGLWLSGAASAATVSPVGLQILVDGVSAGYYDQTQIGCVSGSGESFNCSGTGQFGGTSGMNMTWNMNFDSDPVITGTTAVTNLSGSAQQFTLIFTLPTTVSPSSLMGGGVQGGVTDNTGDGATITAPLGSAIYTALIDSVLVQQTLHADPFSYTEPNAFQNSSFPSANWGTPIPSAPGPAVTTNIRIQLDFILTGNDSASITSNFVVVPVPEPAPATMMLLGLLALALRRRSAH
jgi:MYXO-CTERM domain-containing protein